MRRDRGFLLLFLFLSSFVVLFLLVPLMGLFYSVGFGGLAGALSDPEVLRSIWLTIRTALYAVLIVAVTGIPLAYLIARYEFWGKSMLESLLDIPVMVPHTAAGIALLVAFGSGRMAEWLSAVGLELIDSTTGIIAAMMFLSAPFLINAAKDGFRKVDPKLEKVARTLGANPLQTFFAISIPNARKDIINGALMMWSRGLGEFGAVIILVYHPMTTPVLIFDRFSSYGLSYSAPVAAVIIGLSAVVFLIIRFIANRFD